MVSGDSSSEPTRHAAPNFHAFSRSRVRAYTRIMMKIMYSDVAM
jgi:hypothetical protein